MVADEFSLGTRDWQRQKSGGNGLPAKGHAHENFREFKIRDLGAVIGAVAVTVFGFSSFDWKLGSTTEQMAADRAQTAVIGVLTPICVEKFQHRANATAKTKSQTPRLPALARNGSVDPCSDRKQRHGFVPIVVKSSGQMQLRPVSCVM